MLSSLRRIPNLFKKRAVAAGSPPILTNTSGVGVAHPPKWRADKGAQGPRTFVLLLMVLTRIHPPEPGFFLP
ncbi:MAG: hypothetical protein RSE44_25465, partial [Pseudomonas sp.]